MRITLWRQFSSNHSANFTVVGTFETEPEAEDAANKLLDVLKTVQAWRLQHEDDPLFETYLVNSITPPEAQLSQKYGVDWGKSRIDWVGNEPEKQIRRVGKDVFVGVAFQTWQEPTPIINLITRFGGQTQYQHSNGNQVTVHITCNLPDETKAREIFEVLEPVFRSPRGKRHPWEDVKSREDVYGYGKIQREKRHLIIDYQFFTLEQGFPAMLNWLKSIGATEIEYTLTEEPERTDWN